MNRRKILDPLTYQKIFELSRDAAYANALKYLVNEERSSIKKGQIFSCVCKSNVLVGIDILDSFYETPINDPLLIIFDDALDHKYNESINKKISIYKLRELYIALLSRGSIEKAKNIYDVLIKRYYESSKYYGMKDTPFSRPVISKYIDSRWFLRHIMLMIDCCDSRALHNIIGLIDDTPFELDYSCIQDAIDRWSYMGISKDTIAVFSKLAFKVGMTDTTSNNLIKYIFNTDLEYTTFFQVLQRVSFSKEKESIKIPLYGLSENELQKIESLLKDNKTNCSERNVDRVIANINNRDKKLRSKITKLNNYYFTIVRELNVLSYINKINTDNSLEFSHICPSELKVDVVCYYNYLKVINGAEIDFIMKNYSQFLELHSCVRLKNKLKRYLFKKKDSGEQST